ncbi:FAD-dependent oxidoreductase [Kribbella hippodromi]|uniref:FAD-dependent oxidoreductase n=1 Tax=Kribbella hippodromi TaxID=434347 RepID=A0ABP4PQ09_9ACTN
MTTSEAVRSPVLIVGGGVTGLTVALFLARRGLRPLLVERHPTTAIMPKARAFNPRSLEIYRSAGLEDEIRNHTSLLAGFPEMIGAETLAGGERFRFDLLAQVRPQAGLSPTDWALIDQDDLERVLRAEAERLGADVRFSTELVDLEEQDDGVLATLRDLTEQHEYTVFADYLVAADGNRAGVRQRLGVGADEEAELGHALHFVFEADLSEVLGDRRFLLGYLDRPTPGTVLAPLQKEGRWMLGVPQHDGLTAELTEKRCIELVREATGVADLKVSLVPLVPGSDRLVSDVRIGGWVAHRYRVGRVFFAGDAAHVVPPSGSYGANTGIADAHNLAWKLAAVLGGQPEALLDTYEEERRPVAVTTLRVALDLLHNRHAGSADDIQRIDDITMIFGYRYASAGVRVEDGDPGGEVADPRVPTGRPGLRAPHVWVERNGAKLSTQDLFVDRATLLVGPEGQGWASAAERLTDDLAVLRIGTEVVDPSGDLLKAYGITPRGATLVRPDGFVAWRSVDSDENSDDTLRDALTSAGCRPTA